MKKPKKPFSLEDHDFESLEKTGAGFDDDEEIIDLDEIFELPLAASDDDDDFTNDVEFLDAETGLAVKDIENPLEPEEASEEDDPFKNFAFDSEEDKHSRDLRVDNSTEDLLKSLSTREKTSLFESREDADDKDTDILDVDSEGDLLGQWTMLEKEENAAEEEEEFEMILSDPSESKIKEDQPAQNLMPASSETETAPSEVERSILDDLLEKAQQAAQASIEDIALQTPESPPDAGPKENAPLGSSDEKFSSDMQTPPVESLVAPAAVMAALQAMQTEGAQEPASAAVSEPANAAVPSLEDFVAGIESRLTDMVREMVEARLPDIVRSVLREEIDKLKG